MEPIVIEVKSLLKSGLPLFAHMMDTIDQLKPGQGLVIKSTFNPRPLVSQMKRRGYLVHQEKIGKILMTTFTAPAHQTKMLVHRPVEQAIRGGVEHDLDNRGLVPPEPMQRTMALLGQVPVHDVVVIHNDRVPIFLLNQLDEEGFPYETLSGEDDSATVRILKTHPLDDGED
jgi:uncharacterized protein (DUF2249 family)